MEMTEGLSGVRVPPNSPRAERSVLGTVLRSRETALMVFESLREEDFYDPAMREVYSAMLAVFAAGQPVDLTTLDMEMRRRGKLDAVGGPAFLIELSQAAPFTENAGAYVRIVEEMSTLRKLIQASEEILEESYANQAQTSDILEAAEKRIYDITMRKGGQELERIQDVLLVTYERIEQLVKNHGQTDGVPTGYTDLDNLLTGLHPGELVLVGGRPSMGKTSIGMNFIENAAIRAKKRAAVFSLEMPSEQLAMRMLCTEASVDLQAVRRGQLDDDQWLRLCQAMTLIGNADIYLDATPGISVTEIRSKARRLQLEHGLDVIMIDYLSLMTASGRFGSRQEEVASISRGLKALAIELGVPIIALQQLSRSPTGRANHRPMLSDIRESGAIEQDADVVMFIHREDYYDPNTSEKNIAEIIVAKQRNGALGTVKLGWRGEFTRFMDLNPRPNEANEQSGIA